MKRRVLAVILGMTMVCSMAACGGSSGEKENSESTKEDSGGVTRYEMSVPVKFWKCIRKKILA